MKPLLTSALIKRPKMAISKLEMTNDVLLQDTANILEQVYNDSDVCQDLSINTPKICKLLPNLATIIVSDALFCYFLQA